jgi:exopolyphosphatase/guanosine-5'-triphosphate,3'-diphosphate pyrophosphatase
VAAIDCGTNAIRLLIAEAGGDSPTGLSASPAEIPRDGWTIRDLVRVMEIVRLGEGVDATGRFSPEALTRTFDACRTYADLVKQHRVQCMRFIATSASRDAANREEFIEGVRSILGVTPEVISGDEEARLSFLGAAGVVTGEDLPALVVDIGGGSTEFVLGVTEPIAARSVDIGCVRLTERHLHSDPPTSEEIERTVHDIDRAIDDVLVTVPADQAAALIGLAGSVTTVAALALGLAAYDPIAIHGSRISAADVSRVTQDLLVMTRRERAELAVMHPGRVDVIGGGALILDRILQRLDIPEVIASESDILDGTVRELVAQQRGSR